MRNTSGRRRLAALGGALVMLALGAAGCQDRQPMLAESPGEAPEAHSALSHTVQVPPGFRIEKVVDGLNLPSSLTWDDQGRMYVAEAGGGLEPEQIAPIRILRVEPGRATPIIDLGHRVNNSLVGLTWHHGAFYITHRADDLTGAVSRVTMDGQVQLLFKGIIDSQAEHQINDIKVGPDGRMYVAVGPAGNSGVMDLSIIPWLRRSPNVHTTPCKDIVLTGRNYLTPDFRTPDPHDMVLTGAYVPFGTATTPGQVIQGVRKCGGSILVFDPNNAEATVHMYAWGFRNLIGLAWNRQTGEMYASENGYDVRGSRPVKDELDATLRIRENVWYGVPDFSAGREPLTLDKFEPPEQFQVPVFLGDRPIGKDLGFVIDHAASGLTPPDPSLVFGRHAWSSSPSLLDVAPHSWGDLAGHVFVAEWGDLAPPTNPLLGMAPSGYRVVRVPPTGGQAVPFVQNRQPGPASMQGARGQGIERPFDVKFGPDGAMYIVDYGVVTIDMSKMPPYAYQPGTGVIWKVTRDAHHDLFDIRVLPEHEVPPSNSMARGRTEIRVFENGRIEWEISIQNPAREVFVAGHIHEAPAGHNGPIRLTLFSGMNLTDEHIEIRGSAVDPALAAAILANPSDYYVNFHTRALPAGAIRGQLR